MKRLMIALALVASAPIAAHAAELTPLENGVIQATIVVNYSLYCGHPPDDMLQASIELLKTVKQSEPDILMYAQIANNLARKSVGNAAWCKQVWSK